MSALSVISAEIPAGSTLGYIVGTEGEGHQVCIAGDHRMVAAVADALNGGEDVVVGYEGWQVVGA